MITRFLRLSDQYLSKWEEDIEEVFKRENCAQPSDSAHDAASHLLWALSKSYSAVVSPLILEMFANVQG